MTLERVMGGIGMAVFLFASFVDIFRPLEPLRPIDPVAMLALGLASWALIRLPKSTM